MSTNPINMMGHRRILPAPESLDPREAALGRSRAYGLFACLTASPDDCPRDRTGHGILPGSGTDLPYEWNPAQIAALLQQRNALSHPTLALDYRNLFESALPISGLSMREEDAEFAPVGTRDEILRIYDYFGHRPKSYRKCAPDHLSVELSFMQMLTIKEALSGEDSCDSYALAQLHFLGRHLTRWFPGLAARVTELNPASHYARVFQALDEFLRADHAWRRDNRGSPGIH